ncbi:MAG TPA: stage II sporulation protein P, partial [Oscillospiraceae bacterium]|nr:stage II sporulation protein P [Oscillospiraceae bacterium]
SLILGGPVGVPMPPATRRPSRWLVPLMLLLGGASLVLIWVTAALYLHRDAIEQDGNVIIKPTAEINGRKAAQIMIISGCDDGTMNMPDFFSNLRFAAALQDRMESLYPGLTRPILFDYRKYNMDLLPELLLIEIGSTGNTLEEAEYSAELLGQALISLLKE